MIFQDYPSLYFDTLVQFSIVTERRWYRFKIRRLIKLLIGDVRQTNSVDAFFTSQVLDEGGTYSHCYRLARWSPRNNDGRNLSRTLYLTQTGGFLVQTASHTNEPCGLERLHPDDGLRTAILRQLAKALKSAYYDTQSRRREHEWEKGEHAEW